MLTSDEVKTVLANRTSPEGMLPVIYKGDISGVRVLGDAATIEQADIMGMAAQIVCEKVSRARLQDTQQCFFVLHS